MMLYLEKQLAWNSFLGRTADNKTAHFVCVQTNTNGEME